jgi:hypothetical protein
MASQVFWPLINQRDRNRLYEIEFNCGIFPPWFYDRDPDGLIENLSDRQKIIFLRGVVSLGRDWIREVQEDFSSWVAHKNPLAPRDAYVIDSLREGGGQKTSQEIEQENLKTWMDCYQDTKRILKKAERTYFRLYAKNISKSEPLGNLESMGRKDNG